MNKYSICRNRKWWLSMENKSELLLQLYQARLDRLKEISAEHSIVRTGSVETLRSRLIKELILDEWDLDDRGIKGNSLSHGGNSSWMYISCKSALLGTIAQLFCILTTLPLWGQQRSSQRSSRPAPKSRRAKPAIHVVSNC